MVTLHLCGGGGGARVCTREVKVRHSPGLVAVETVVAGVSPQGGAGNDVLMGGAVNNQRGGRRERGRLATKGRRK